MLGIVRVGSLVALLTLGLTVAIAPPAEAKSGKSGKSGKSNRIETVLKGTESFASAKGKAACPLQDATKDV